MHQLVNGGKKNFDNDKMHGTYVKIFITVFSNGHYWTESLAKSGHPFNRLPSLFSLVALRPNIGYGLLILEVSTRVGTLIVATIYLQLIQNKYMFRSFTVLHCSHQHCVQPVASDVEVVGYL